ncbi:MAG: CYTH domain-containing protein [bacterium]|nr:CYTH domain-containing protein [bacterium]
MKSNATIIEAEYQYLIPRSKLNLAPPANLDGFSLADIENIEIKDVLLERKNISLKSEKIGIRIRKVGQKKELTYKKFLGKENGITKFDEQTLEIDDKTYSDFSRGVFDYKRFSIFDALRQKGEFYVMITISNKRKIYHYTDSRSRVELIIEDICYKTNGKKAQDAMIEIEIKHPADQEAEIKKLAEYIRDYYFGRETNEGKNSRGMFLLGIPYEQAKQDD